MIIDRTSSTPLHEQLRLILQDQILLGELSPGVLLATEQQLCDQFGISRITVRHALQDLERAGLIERIQGRGSMVRKRDISTSKKEVRGFTQSMLMQGVVPRSVLLDKELIKGTPDLIELFQLPQNGPYQFWRFRRLRFIGAEPVVIMNHYVRKELGDIMLAYDLGDISFYALFEKILNQQIHDSEGLISAVQASPENSRLLEVTVGAPLIWYRGIAYLEGKITVEVNYSLFIGDKFQFETQMFKPRTSSIDLEKNAIASQLTEVEGGG